MLCAPPLTNPHLEFADEEEDDEDEDEEKKKTSESLNAQNSFW